MSKKILISIAFLLCCQFKTVDANNDLFLIGRRSSTTGIIQTVGRNMLEILDEWDHELRTFIYIGNTDQLHKGDRVRIYYRPKDKFIENLIKMTPVPYQKDHQNLGNIFRKE